MLSLAVLAMILGGADLVKGQKSSAPEGLVAVPARTLSYGLVVDNSGSFRAILERVISSTTAIIDDSRPDDEGFLVTFVDTAKISLRQEMTGNKESLRDAAENMFIEGGPTAILDALMFSAKYMSGQSTSQPDRSRVLILITDGDERESAASGDEVIKALKAANIRVFVLGLHDEKIYTKVIDRVSKETGGAKFVARSPKDTSSAVASLLSAIRPK